jgi:CubicO group peptidase (beta-lactamase class C family)
LHGLAGAIAAVLLSTGLAAVYWPAAASTATSAPTASRCAAPTGAWQRAEPADVGMDATKLQDALDWATLYTGLSLAVVRHGCLVGNSRLEPLTAAQAFDGWSMTKSVTALLVGRAVTLGLFDIDAPLSTWFPEADAAHGALTPRDLLTMTSGLHVNWVRDLSPQPDRIRDALSLPVDFAPGTEWQYAQSTVTWLANALERAVGEDLQSWAQRELFGPIGVDAGTWTWDRDRAGHTEGWAHLKMRATDFARFGQLILNDGEWGASRLVSGDYLAQATTSTSANDAYGFLIWLNSGKSYVLPDIEGRDVGQGRLVPAAPTDAIVFAGAGEQRMWAVPSRDLVVVRVGDRGSKDPDTRISVWSGRAGQVDHEVMRRVLGAVTDVAYADPGPYMMSGPRITPIDDGLIGDARDVDGAAAGLGAGSHAPAGCNPLGCN